MQYPRYMKPYLKECLKDTPVVLLHGSRQSGKTTLALEVGGKRYRYITFDDSTEVTSAKSDPRGYVEGLPKYCILDEIQKVPELFPSIKQSIDKVRTPGRFLLTGSANILALPKLSESLAGRMEVVNLRPLAQTEIEKSDSKLIEHLFNKTINKTFKKRLDDELVERIFNGGYPEPLLRSNGRRKSAWYRNYLSIILQKDIIDFSNIQHSEEMPKILNKIANNSAQLTNVSEINKGLGIDAKTTKKYIQLLNQIFLIEELQPWHSNRNKRLVKTPKLHVTDTGLLVNLLSLNEKQLLKEKVLLGNILETFIYNELKKQAGWYTDHINFFHYRDKDQYEVDIVMEDGSGSIVGIEVKRSASVNTSDFSGLKRLKKQTKDSFIAGYIMYDGERSLPFGEELYAIPIQTLWSKS